MLVSDLTSIGNLVSGMRTARAGLCFGAVLALTGASVAAVPSEVPPLHVSDLPGSYELVERDLANSKVLRRPDIAALYTFGHGRANFNLFIRNPNGTLSSESSIIRYTLSRTEYCEWIEYTTRNNLDAPGVSNQAPPVTSHCTPIRIQAGRVVFAPPGESVVTTWDRHGFTAVIKGQFTDHWRKIE